MWQVVCIHANIYIGRMAAERTAPPPLRLLERPPSRRLPAAPRPLQRTPWWRRWLLALRD
jgi:hypothetical protein